MQIAQHTAHLPCPVACSCLCNPTSAIDAHDVPFFFQHTRERHAIDEIHHQVMLATFHKEVADAWNAGMIEVEQQGCFALKPFYCLLSFCIRIEVIKHLF